MLNELIIILKNNNKDIINAAIYLILIGLYTLK